MDPRYFSVYSGGSKLTMEEPADCTNFTYKYMEVIDGSVFVAGSYDVEVFEDFDYRVFAVWRDGNIVFSVDDDGETYSDGNLGYKTADFE